MKYQSEENAPTGNFRGTAFYDGDCSICRGLVERWGSRLARRGFVFRTIEEGKAAGGFPFPVEEFDAEMKLQAAVGRWYGGVDAILVLMGSIWWVAPLAWLGRLPGFHWIAQRLYRYLAANRHCLGRTCGLPGGR